MVKNAEITPPNTNPDPMAPDSSTKEGRGALPDWHAHGFITPMFSRAVSRAVDYAYNDFSLYQVAAGLGRSEDAAKYRESIQKLEKPLESRLEFYRIFGICGSKEPVGIC